MIITPWGNFPTGYQVDKGLRRLVSVSLKEQRGFSFRGLVPPVRQDVGADLRTTRMQGNRSPCQPCYPSTLSQSSVLLRSLPDGIHPSFLHVCMHTFSHVQLLAAPCTIAYQVSLSMNFSRQEYGSGMSFPPPRDFPNPGVEPMSPESTALAGRFFNHCATWETPPPFFFYQFPVIGRTDAEADTTILWPPDGKN